MAAKIASRISRLEAQAAARIAAQQAALIPPGPSACEILDARFAAIAERNGGELPTVPYDAAAWEMEINSAATGAQRELLGRLHRLARAAAV